MNRQLLNQIKQFDDSVSENFGNLDPGQLRMYGNLIKNIQPMYQAFAQSLLQIGRLQLLRKLITKQIYFSAKAESAQYSTCLETLNYTFLHNLDEIKDTAKRTFVEREEEIQGLLGGNETMNQTRLLTPQQ